MRDKFIQTLLELAKRDKRIFLITGDLGFGVLDRFAAELPDQFINVGVAEQNMTGIAAGMALDGRIVFTYSIANFPTLRCLEQIRNDASYHNLNVNIVAVGGGFSYGSLGMSHHATEDLAIMRALPIDVVAPCSLWETQEATKAIIKSCRTSYLRIDKSLAQAPCLKGEIFKLGKARWLRFGKALTLIALGGIVHEALLAADICANYGIDLSVLSMHTIQPLDIDAIEKAVSITGGIITIEEHSVKGGLGGVVAEVCMELAHRPKLFFRVGLRNGFSSIVGTQKFLRKKHNMDKNFIIRIVLQLLGKSKTELSDNICEMHS